jgi:hypothetical protein
MQVSNYSIPSMITGIIFEQKRRLAVRIFKPHLSKHGIKMENISLKPFSKNHLNLKNRLVNGSYDTEQGY